MGTSITASTSACAVWMTRGMRRSTPGAPPDRRGMVVGSPPGAGRGHWPPLVVIHSVARDEPPSTPLPKAWPMPSSPPRPFGHDHAPGSQPARGPPIRAFTVAHVPGARRHAQATEGTRPAGTDPRSAAAAAEPELSTHARAFALALPPGWRLQPPHRRSGCWARRRPHPAPPGRDEPLDVMRAKGRPRVPCTGCVAHRGAGDPPRPRWTGCGLSRRSTPGVTSRGTGRSTTCSGGRGCPDPSRTQHAPGSFWPGPSSVEVDVTSTTYARSRVSPEPVQRPPPRAARVRLLVLGASGAGAQRPRPRPRRRVAGHERPPVAGAAVVASTTVTSTARIGERGRRTGIAVPPSRTPDTATSR